MASIFFIDIISESIKLYKRLKNKLNKWLKYVNVKITKKVVWRGGEYGKINKFRRNDHEMYLGLRRRDSIFINWKRVKRTVWQGI